MKRSNVIPETLEKLYWDDKLSLADIGGIYSVTKRTMARWFEYFDIPRRSGKDATVLNSAMIKSNRIQASDELSETLKKLYWDDKLSLADIGELYDISMAMMYYWFEYFGIPRRVISESHIKGKMLPKIPEKILKKLYWEDGLILKDIGVICGFSEFTILKYFQYYGIPCRSRYESTLKNNVDYPDLKERQCEIQQNKWNSMSEDDRLIHAKHVSAGRQGISYDEWDEFISIDTKWRDTVEYKDWAFAVIKRDNNTCRLCNTKIGIKHRHHIYPVRNYPELKYDVENGITLCPDCHIKTYGCEEEWADTFIMLIN